MKKVLFTATVDSHIMNFHTPYLKYFKDNGFEVHVASNGTTEIPSTDFKYNISFARSPFQLDNLKAYKELKRILNSHKFDLIHCHTPMGAVITRIAARKHRKHGTKIIYTAHGFHFFKGAPVVNWLFFYPIERWLSRYTDCLITINNEDYRLAKKKFKAHEVKLINGVGIDLDKFRPQTVEAKKEERAKYGYDLNDFILIYVGELSHRKHQDLLIESISLLKNKIPNIRLLLVGNGDKLEEYQVLVSRLLVEEHVKFLGYRNDINKLMILSDIAISSSRQEGLPVNIMEAIAVGLPLIVSNSRGNRDLVSNERNGFIFEKNNIQQIIRMVEKLYLSKDLKEDYQEHNMRLRENYSIEIALQSMSSIYEASLSGK
ncbi:glycosyltransferase family 4 protein [Paenibacillus sp. NPDC058177]|uniref:glycosyltransferase family 4 protein n=1 Tax=Paenibacillus sp. NPDC058177 TaxID=3346369 RepID=UPI0036D95FCE